MKVSSRNLMETAFIQEQLAKSSVKYLVTEPGKAPQKMHGKGLGKELDNELTKAPAKAKTKTHVKPLPQSDGTHAYAGPAGEVRIIGGLWKRSKLPVAKHPGLRPTPNRVRETLFNWLGQDMSGLRCVDAFAGTGALGLEAASRGAQDVLLVESDSKLFTQLLTTKTKLKAEMVRIQRGDGIATLQALARGSVDVVFIDPPFEAPIFDKAILAAAHAVKAQGAIYLEAPKAWTDVDLAPFGVQLVRSGKAGMVHYHLLKLMD
jgi:16S rRNA (guanine966-N2)-methyltransferase